MKVCELFESPGMKIFHASSSKFKKFHAKPSWFSLNDHDAKGWHDIGMDDHGESITYVCKYIGGKIATEEQAEKVAKEVWPDDTFIYSMFDERVGEWPVAEVREFIKLMQKAGYAASYLTDYDPRNSDKDSTTLCVFDPSKDVEIESTKTE